MEIELSGFKPFPHPRRRLFLLALGLAGVILLGFIGSRYTPLAETGRPQALTWSEWQVLRLARQYRLELGRMQREVDGLVALFQRPPDPVRAQLTAERIARQYAEGSPALAHPRAALIAAAVAVQDWSVGAASPDAARRALQAAGAALDQAQDAP